MAARLDPNEPMDMDYLLYRIRRNIVEIGDCWEWQGNTTSGQTPTMRYFLNGKWSASPVRRVIVLVKGMKISDKQRAIARCGNQLCVNPDHVGVDSVSKIMLERNRIITSGAIGRVRAAKIAEKQRANLSPLTMDQVREIRSYKGPAHAKAHEYGVSVKTFNAVRSGERWKDYSNPWLGLFR